MSEGVLGSAIVGIVRRVRLRRTTAVLICALLMGLPALLIGAPDAAADDIEGCSLFGNRPSIDVDSSVIERFRGSWMALHDAEGLPIDHNAEVSKAQSPLCIAQVSDSGVGVPEWAFCLDYLLPSCGQDQLVSSDNPLGVSETSLVSWIIDQALSESATSAELRAAQRRVWCVTNPGVTDIASESDFSISGVSNCEEYRSWLASEVLPYLTLPSSELDVQVVYSPMLIRFPIEVTIRSTVKRLNLEVEGAATAALCAGEGNATLSGSELSIDDTASPVALCISGLSAGEVIVSVSAPPQLGPARVVSSAQGDCQALLAGLTEVRQLTERVAAEFIDPSAPTKDTTSTTSSSVPPELTTTVPQPSSTVSTTTGPEESSTTLPGTSGPSTSQSTRSETAALGARDRRGGQRPERMAHTGSSFVVLIAAGAGLIALGGALLAIQVRRRVA